MFLKKITAIILTVICLIMTVVLPSAADSYVKVYIDNKRFSGGVQVKNQTTYVDIKSFASAMYPSSYTTYVKENETLYVKSEGLYMMCENDSNYIIANERYLYHEMPLYVENGVMYAPIMQLYRAFDAKIKWSDSVGGFYVTRGSGAIESGKDYYRDDEIYWMSRIINAEAQGEELVGKIAVGNVILNRVNSDEFPNTIYGVIFDKKFGVQFTPTANGTINAPPNTESIIAAKICLEYYTVSPDILYFVNPDISPDSWASNNRPYFKKIGNHEFYY